MGFFFLMLYVYSITTASCNRSERLLGEDSVIPGQYVVVLRDEAPETRTINSLVMNKAQGVSSLRTEGRIVIGKKQFLTITGSSQDIDNLRNNPLVKVIGPNVVVKAFSSDNTTGRDVTNSVDPETTTESVAFECRKQIVPDLWGLDRLDQRQRVSSPNEYIYGWPDGQGTSVLVYVVDSGVNVSHSEFENRATWGFTADDVGPDQDENGHGTHVAGTIGAVTFGVAKGVSIVAVKVLNRLGVGSAKGLVSGFEWLFDDFLKRGRPKSVVNLSLGFAGISEPVEEAVQAIIDEGITVVVAAGNSNQDACFVTPARIPNAITVGAHDVDDTAAGFSNWGPCLDIWAPGVNIISIYLSANFSANGTSMAAPHVTGVIARYLSTVTSEKSIPIQVGEWLDAMATRGRLTFLDSYKATSPDKIVFIDCAEGWTTPLMKTTVGSHQTTSSFSLTCFFLGLICSFFRY